MTRLRTPEGRAAARGLSAIDRVFQEYGNRATGRDYREAARFTLAQRRACNAAAASTLAGHRRDMWKAAKRAGVHVSDGKARPFLAVLSRSIRECHGRLNGRDAYPRATLVSLRREAAGLERAAEYRRSEAHAARMRSLPCGLQDADSSAAFYDSVLLRLVRIMIRIVERESGQ